MVSFEECRAKPTKAAKWEKVKKPVQALFSLRCLRFLRAPQFDSFQIIPLPEIFWCRAKSAKAAKALWIHFACFATFARPIFFHPHLWAVSSFAFGARVCDPQQRDLQDDVLRLTEPRSVNEGTAHLCAGLRSGKIIAKLSPCN